MASKRTLAGIWLAALVAIALVQARGAAVGQPAASPTTLPSSPTAPPADAATGRALFVAKGCASCHIHNAFGSAPTSIGPVLSDYQPDPTYLRRWLRDPAAVKPGTQMPNLRLSAAEIEALIAFLQE